MKVKQEKELSLSLGVLVENNATEVAAIFQFVLRTTETVCRYFLESV